MAIIKKYLAEVFNIENRIEGIYTVELKSMSGPFKYLPGQFMHLTLDEYKPSEGWPESRCFSMQSNPSDELIRITYAVKGQFTCRMQHELKVNCKVTLKLPYGDLFVQEHNKINTVFISGGTGITPFLSLFTNFSFESYENPILYAGFRNEKMNLYQDELETAKRINAGLEINLVYQDKNGILNIEEIYEKSNNNSSFFISGPPMMIREFQRFLIQVNIPKDQIKTDDWA